MLQSSSSQSFSQGGCVPPRFAASRGCATLRTCMSAKLATASAASAASAAAPYRSTRSMSSVLSISRGILSCSSTISNAAAVYCAGGCKAAARATGPAGRRRQLMMTSASVAAEDEVAGSSSSSSSRGGSIETETDVNGVTRLILKKEGYSTWDWRGLKVNYVAARNGNGSSSPPLVLVHGFGASVYHWRYNIPSLSENYDVYALDLLGFGWSDKELIVYSPALWRDQIADFVREVVQRPAVLVGNSVGGYAVLATGSSYPDITAGLVLVNAAGRFEQTGSSSSSSSGSGSGNGGGGRDGEAEPSGLEAVKGRVSKWLEKAFKRVALYLTFLQAKQPSRIESVLRTVYRDKTNVDDTLVQSIVLPTAHPNAAEVYFRLTSEVLLHPSALSMNQLLAPVAASSTPVLLLWGEFDPWVTPSKADSIQQLLPTAQRVDVAAGHCPHDESPEAVNRALDDWVKNLGTE